MKVQTKNKIFRVLILIMTLALITLVMFACSETDDSDQTPQTYTIQYTDNNGNHTITVEAGGIYSLTDIPTKVGHKFKGLFDSQIGGTQYVNEFGGALSAFTDNKNLVLYPQFEALKYTIELDYQGAPVTGSREIVVEYGSHLANLPISVEKENMVFLGWYTKPNCQGVQIADSYGVIPSKSTVDNVNFSLPDANGYIYLYAGFEMMKYTVSFYATANSTVEEIEVEHGTHISKVVPTTRVDGKAVYSWSKSKSNPNDIFSGVIVSDMILYGAEYAPVIDFDVKGGEEIVPIVEKAGQDIVLPTPTRENYLFLEWVTAGGEAYTDTIMPEDSIKLTAKWQAKLVFEENGGKEVKDISQAVGESIELPTTEKEGFIFAGWYTTEGQKYESKSMPNESVILKAGWYKIKTEIKILIEANETYGSGNTPKTPIISNSCHILDLSELYQSGVENVKLTLHYKSSYIRKAGGDFPFYTYMSIYNTDAISEVYKVVDYQEKHTSSEAVIQSVRELKIELTTPKLYICRYCSYTSVKAVSSTFPIWSDFWVEIEYPDTSVLY